MLQVRRSRDGTSRSRSSSRGNETTTLRTRTCWECEKESNHYAASCPMRAGQEGRSRGTPGAGGAGGMEVDREEKPEREYPMPGNANIFPIGGRY